VDSDAFAMSVTASQLSRTGAKGKVLDKIVRDLLLIIDNKLLESEKTWGRNVVSVELPIDFGLGRLDKKTAQRIIYSSIIRNLKDRGFEVRIFLTPEKTMLYVVWDVDVSDEEIKAMNAVIRSNIIRGEQLQEFLDGKK
jgi:hypothetical protein